MDEKTDRSRVTILRYEAEETPEETHLGHGDQPKGALPIPLAQELGAVPASGPARSEGAEGAKDENPGLRTLARLIAREVWGKNLTTAEHLGSVKEAPKEA